MTSMYFLFSYFVSFLYVSFLWMISNEKKKKKEMKNRTAKNQNKLLFCLASSWNAKSYYMQWKTMQTVANLFRHILHDLLFLHCGLCTNVFTSNTSNSLNLVNVNALHSVFFSFKNLRGNILYLKFASVCHN